MSSFCDILFNHICIDQSNFVRRDDVWDVDKDQFLTNCVNRVKCCIRKSIDASIIPKTLHFIWLGSPLSEHHQRIINSWTSFHNRESWNVRVWQETDLDSVLGDTTKRLVEKSPNYGMKSDIIRYEILRMFGGIYADLDYECLDKLDLLFENLDCSFFCGLSNTSSVEVNNGIMGCVASHPILETLLAKISEDKFFSGEERGIPLKNIGRELLQYTYQDSQSFLSLTEQRSVARLLSSCSQPQVSNIAIMETLSVTGPGALTRVLAECLSDDLSSSSSLLSEKHKAHHNMPLNLLKTVVVLPVAVFHAIPNTTTIDLSNRTNDPCVEAQAAREKEQLKATFVQPGLTVAVHWWQRSWQKQIPPKKKENY